MIKITSNFILDALKSRIEREVASKIKLQKPPKSEKESNEIEFVNPTVNIMYLPPGNALPQGYNIPAILIGIDDAEDNNNESNISIRFTFAVYCAGTHANDKFLNDFEGYRDILNLIERTKINLFSNPVVEGRTIVNKPVKYGIHEESLYPYWYGFMTFKVSCPQIEPVLDI